MILVDENEGDLELLIEIMFEQDIDLANVSFVKLFDSGNEEVTCLYAYDWADTGNSIEEILSGSVS